MLVPSSSSSRSNTRRSRSRCGGRGPRPRRPTARPRTSAPCRRSPASSERSRTSRPLPHPLGAPWLPIYHEAIVAGPALASGPDGPSGRAYRGRRDRHHLVAHRRVRRARQRHALHARARDRDVPRSSWRGPWPTSSGSGTRSSATSDIEFLQPVRAGPRRLARHRSGRRGSAAAG